jgi:hypothetical protein
MAGPGPIHWRQSGINSACGINLASTPAAEVAAGALNATCPHCLEVARSVAAEVSQPEGRGEPTLPKPRKAKKQRKASDPVASLTAAFRAELAWIEHGRSAGWLGAELANALRTKATEAFTLSVCAAVSP